MAIEIIANNGKKKYQNKRPEKLYHQKNDNE
jgi:hypothetical protein